MNKAEHFDREQRYAARTDTMKTITAWGTIVGIIAGIAFVATRSQFSIFERVTFVIAAIALCA
jgi:hypothetical protein